MQIDQTECSIWQKFVFVLYRVLQFYIKGEECKAYKTKIGMIINNEQCGALAVYLDANVTSSL